MLSHARVSVLAVVLVAFAVRAAALWAAADASLTFDERDYALRAQALLGALSVLLVYALGRAWFDHRCGVAAAWLAALYPNLVAFTRYLWSISTE